MSDLTAKRREDLIASLDADGVEALLVWSVTNVSYLTGFTGDDSTVIVGRDRTLIVSDGRYETQLAQECPGIDVHIRPVGQLMKVGIPERIKLLGIKRLGIESASISVADFHAMQEAMPTVELVPLEGKVEALRVIKDDSEVAEIRRAVAFAQAAFERLRAGLKPGLTEKEITDTLEADLRKCGATASAFAPIIGVGRNAALPHYHGTDLSKIGDDDFVLVDWGASAGPFKYKSDLTRMVVTGKVTPKFEEIYGLVLAAQAAGIAAIRPGITGREVDAAARAVIEKAGHGASFNHGLGHGLGMDIHEAPRLRHESDIELKPGMVVTVEPGLYFPDWGGVRIEDDVLVTPDGREVLTSTPKALETVVL